jgi:integrase
VIDNAANREAVRLASDVRLQRVAAIQRGELGLRPKDSPLFSEYAKDWLDRKRPPRTRPKTFESYEDAISRLTEVFGHTRIGSLTREEIESYLVSGPLARPHHKDQKKAPQPLSKRTLNYLLVVLRMALGDAVESGILQRNVARQVKPLNGGNGEEREVMFLTPEQAQALFQVAPEPYRTLYMTAIDAGLRRGEALALKARDVDLQRGRLFVRQQRIRLQDSEGHYIVQDVEPKTRGSKTWVEGLTHVTLAGLRNLIASDPNGYVFRNEEGKPFDPDSVDGTFRKHLKEATGLQYGMHSLRHTCAVWLIHVGAHPKAIAARLRHATIQVTMDTYGNLMSGAHQGLGEKLEGLLSGGVLGTNWAPNPVILPAPVPQSNSLQA